MRSSTELRASASAKAFVGGLLNTSLDIEVDAKLCYFNKKCKKYQLEVHDNKTTYAQTKKLYKSKEWSKMIQRVVRKTGVDMDPKMVHLTWEVCREERSWNYPFQSVHDYPAWCSLFNWKDLKLLEFSDDLDQYNMLGPSFKITSKMTEPVFKVGFKC